MIESWSEQTILKSEKWFGLKRWDDSDSGWPGNVEKAEKVKSEFRDTENISVINKLPGKTGFWFFLKNDTGFPKIVWKAFFWKSRCHVKLEFKMLIEKKRIAKLKGDLGDLQI